MNGSAEGFADYGVVIDPDRNWLASVMERAQRTINILLGLGWKERNGHGKRERGGWPQILRCTVSCDPVSTNRYDNWTINFGLGFLLV